MKAKTQNEAQGGKQKKKNQNPISTKKKKTKASGAAQKYVKRVCGR